MIPNLDETNIVNTKSWFFKCWQLQLFPCLALVGIINTGVSNLLQESFGSRAYAQIAPDTTLGVESSIATSEDKGIGSDRIDGGAIRESNLFHSFTQFNVGEGRAVYFTNPTGIENIFSRVTGSSRSEILGKLGVLGSANLFLINPNGIIFGSNASLDVGGSFIATTANAIQFGNQGFFSASAPANNLFTVNPSALLFNGVAAQRIVNQSQAQVAGDVVGLQVPPDQTLALIGGEVLLEGGLTAPEGRIELGSVASSGTVSITPQAQSWILDYKQVPAFGNVVLTRGAAVDASGAGGGSIQVQGSSVALTEGAEIIAHTLGDQNGGEIYIQALKLQLQNGAVISASTFGSGEAGNLTVSAADTVELIGVGGREFLKKLLEGSFSAFDIRNGLYTVSFSDGAAGNISVTTGGLIVKDGAEISSSTYKDAQGAGGSINIRASDSVQVIGSLLFAGTQGAGNGGDLNIDTKKLVLSNFGTITTDPFAQGQGGDLTINASESVEVIGAATDDPFFVTGIFSNSLPLSEDIDAGDSGDITINTRQLIVKDGGEIGAGTFGNGQGGNLTINAAESIEVIGVTPDQFRFPSNIYADTFGTGDIGDLTVATKKLIIRDGGQISAATFAAGRGGNLDVNASDSVEVTGSAPIGIDPDSNEFFYFVDNQFPSGLISSSVAAGDAGDLTINTRQLVVNNGAQVTASSTGSGDAGNIDINVRGTLQANNGSISTAAAQAAGGAIDISAKNIRLLGNSDITTNVFSGVGGGGDITLKADSIVAFDDSDILAFSVDGSGGNINLNTPGFFGLRSNTSDIDPALLNNNGRVDINARGKLATGAIALPELNSLQNSLTELPENLIDTNNLIANSCITRRQQQGSFIITGAGGLPSRPGDAVISPYPTGTVRNIPNTTASNFSPSSSNDTRSWQPGDPIVEPQGVYKLANGELVLSRECS